MKFSLRVHTGKRLFERILKLPEADRSRMPLIIMALEDLFHTHKFGIDLLSNKRREELYALMKTFARPAS